MHLPAAPLALSCTGVQRYVVCMLLEQPHLRILTKLHI